MVGTRRGLRNIKIDQQLRLEVQLLTGPKLPAMGVQYHLGCRSLRDETGHRC
jgi:hypothetical protein